MKSKKDTSVIPKGEYCYTIKKIVWADNGMPIIKTNMCPYYSSRDYGEDVTVDFCEFLGKGDYGGLNDDEYALLLAYFKGDEEKMRKELPLGLLWDACKECGVNEGEYNG